MTEIKEAFERPEYTDELAISFLQRWGAWYHSESKMPDLGFPKQSPFIQERVGWTKTDSMKLIHEDDTNSAIPELIHGALRMNRTFMQVAEISYVYCRGGCSIPNKARLLKQNNFYLGSSEDACRKKYKELEQNLHSYIGGFITYHEIND
ncbi:hypothetical protein N9043_01045 [bacterium]|nr:hypothetical protein [bacterium]